MTRCELTTYEPEGLLDLSFVDQERVQRLIMKVCFSLPLHLDIVEGLLTRSIESSRNG